MRMWASLVSLASALAILPYTGLLVSEFLRAIVVVALCSIFCEICRTSQSDGSMRILKSRIGGHGHTMIYIVPSGYSSVINIWLKGYRKVTPAMCLQCPILNRMLWFKKGNINWSEQNQV